MTIPATASQIRSAVETDIATIKRKVVEAENNLARQIYDDCRGNTPVATGELVSGWGIAVGLYDRGMPGGDNETSLAARGFGVPLFIYNNDFRAYFFEHGTVKMAPRPMVAPAIERANQTKVKA